MMTQGVAAKHSLGGAWLNEQRKNGLSVHAMTEVVGMVDAVAREIDFALPA
jgi:hypothetical protein